jgi:DNA-directed RNA polymerase II subunit RPB1
MFHVQLVVDKWLVEHGFSVGLNDTLPDLESNNKIENILRNAKTEVIKYFRQAQNGTLEHQPGKSILQSFEFWVNKALNTSRVEAGKVVKRSLPARNGFKNMVQSGSKGSDLNISQIIAVVG